MHYNWLAISSALSLLIVHKFKIKILSLLSRQSIHKTISPDCARKENIINFVLFYIIQEKKIWLEEKEMPFEGIELLTHHWSNTWEVDLNVIHSHYWMCGCCPNLGVEKVRWENLKPVTYFFPFTSNNLGRQGYCLNMDQVLHKRNLF